ncbi:hypothetical protein DTL42_19220 [Bremerella cremea]|uniref:Uncharacterized protein n=1 Tax=Bremerella cremea TaxID=1031537 RepID=A0A368KMA0_9BACT|nr:hypothetical protein [Bremerella cremea]RCS43204.1 hypothetical protein DTL42_19220 [Bremerella cremea]
MSNLVSYVIDLPGRDVIPSLAPSYQPNEAALKEVTRTGSLWDGRLIESSVDFSIELSGEITVVWLTTRYSNFISDPVVHDFVINWENILSGLLEARIVRVDEFLLNQWESERGDFWFREKGAFAAFIEWVIQKPSESWSLL